MSAFYVGQRVRVIYSDGWPELAGCEGTIRGRATVEQGKQKGKLGWLVAPDAWGTEVAPYIGLNGGGSFSPLESQLQPILPDGLESLTEINALYEPSPEVMA